MFLLKFVLVIGIVSLGQCRLQDDNCWELVFRGLAGIGKQIYQAWTKKTTNPCTLAGGCIPNNLDLAVSTLPNNTHLKSPLVDQWSSLDIEQVKLEFHDEKRVMYMVFNGTKTAYNNWFVKDKLLESSFNDLYSDGCLKYFSLTAAYAKRFAVVQEGFSCTPAYYWWVTIADYKYSSASYRCLFEKSGAYPLLVYAPSQHKSKSNDPKSKRQALLFVLVLLQKLAHTFLLHSGV